MLIMRVENTSQESCKKIKMIVYGRAGAGKTTMIRTLPGRPLVISAESGLRSLRTSNIDFIDITKDDSGNVLPECDRRNRLVEVYGWITSGNAKDFKWIVLDSFSEICEVVIAEMRKKYDITVKRQDTRPMYQEAFHILRMITKAFRDLPNHNVMLTALSEQVSLGGGQQFHSIVVSGKIRTTFASMFDIVFFVEAQTEKKRQLICRENPFTESKDRTNQLDMIMPPDLSVAINKINEGERRELQ